MTDLILVDYDYVRKWQVSAAREGVCVKPTASRTMWFRDKEHRGFCGLIEYATNKWRIKGVYVQPECRGQGFGTEMTEALIACAIALKPGRLEVIAMNSKFYEARGFTKEAELRPGSYRLALGT